MEDKKIFMIAQVIQLDIANLILWPMISKYAKEIADETEGEYSVNTVHAHIVGKLNSDIFVAYKLPWNGEKDPTNTEMYNAIMAHLLSDKREEGFIGYVIQQFDLTRGIVNLWQVFIKPEFRGTNIHKQGMEWLRTQAVEAGAKALACSSYKPETFPVIEHAGFKRDGRVNFTMDLTKG